MVKANRVDAPLVDHKNKKVWAVEMSCPWMEHRGKEDGQIRATVIRAEEAVPWRMMLNNVTSSLTCRGDGQGM